MKQVLVMEGPVLKEAVAVHEAVLKELDERLERCFRVLIPNRECKLQFCLEEVGPWDSSLASADLTGAPLLATATVSNLIIADAQIETGDFSNVIIAGAQHPHKGEPELRVAVTLVRAGSMVWRDWVTKRTRADPVSTEILGWLERWTTTLQELTFWYQTLNWLIADGLVGAYGSLRVNWWGGVGVEAVAVSGATGRAGVAYVVQQTEAGWSFLEGDGWPALLAEGPSAVCVATDSQRANVLRLLTEAHARLEAEKWQC